MRRIFWIFILFAVCTVQAQKPAEIERVTDLLQSGKTEQAQKLLKEMLRENETLADARYLLGVIHLMRGDYERAIEELERAIAINGNDYTYYERLGDAYGLKAQKGNIFSALFVIGDMRSSWEKAIELKPDVVSARERLFTYYLVAPGIAGGDMDKALMLAGEVVKLNPVRGHLLLGRYYQKSEEMAKAEQEYMTAVRLDSTNVNTINTIGYFYLNRDEPQKALPWFTRYVKLAPDAPNAYDSRGDCFVKNGQPDSALVMFKIALSKDPQFEPSLYKQAKMLKRLGRRAEARTACALYLKQYPDGRYAEEIKSLFEEK